MKWFSSPPIALTRWVVIDCETSGLDIARDRLLSVGAVAVREQRVQPAETFQARVRQANPSARDNILIHGIGGDAQGQGRELGEVIDELADFLADAVPVAFHAAFDAGILRRHGLKPRAGWLDLAGLAPALYPGRAARARSLDDWLAAFGIPAEARHDALGDAFATAQLLLVLLAEAKRQGLETVQDLSRTERAGRWLAGR